jgi:hypothetical protein
MGTLENLSALAVELRAARDRLEALAERAQVLQRRLRDDGPTIVSLDKLAQERRPAVHVAERFEGEEASFASDWEISLVSEEGK